MGLTINSSPDKIAAAYEAYVDRCHDEYYGDDYAECPECEEETLETVSSGSNRKGWWIEQVCHNEKCGYKFDDAEPYDDYDDYDY